VAYLPRAFASSVISRTIASPWSIAWAGTSSCSWPSCAGSIAHSATSRRDRVSKPL
jgi:hypothetical protein